MKKLTDYLTKEGWKRDLNQTITDLDDISILTRRFLGLTPYSYSTYFYGMTSKERKEFEFDSKALWFKDEEEFMRYASINKMPFGPCTIGYGKNAQRIDDTLTSMKPNYSNLVLN